MNPEIKAVVSDSLPAPIGPYSVGVTAGPLLFVSGQLPVNPNTGEIVAGGAGEQATQSLRNLKSIVEAAGLSLRNVVKTLVLLADIDDFAEVNAAYAEFFPEDQTPPARSAFQAAALPRGALVEIEAIAYKG